jgi:hypothetical protein
VSSNKLEFKGLTELQRALRECPEDLTQQAATIVETRAERAVADTRTSYPTGPTGNLERGVRKSRRDGKRFSAGFVVRTSAPHASVYEQGSKVRRTSRGFNRGKMPAANIFIPIAIRQRRAMTNELIELVRRAGFQVNE